MTIKDFSKGQPAFSVSVTRHNGVSISMIQQWTVTGIGRKYLKAVSETGCKETFREPDFNSNYLIEKTEYPPNLMLFPSLGMADAHIETEELRSWAVQFFNRIDGILELSAAQLKAIRHIVEAQDVSFCNCAGLVVLCRYGGIYSPYRQMVRRCSLSGGKIMTDRNSLILAMLAGARALEKTKAAEISSFYRGSGEYSGQAAIQFLDAAKILRKEAARLEADDT